jgi:hypothetical protein
LSSCGGKKYKRRNDFIKWDKANCTRSLIRSAKSSSKIKLHSFIE